MRDKGKSGVSEKTHGGEVVRGAGDTDVSGVAVAAVLGTREEDWAVRNRRRISLIAKQFSQGLNPDEERELGQLQAEADRYLDEVAPLPFEHLKKQEERVRLLAIDRVGSDSDAPEPS